MVTSTTAVANGYVPASASPTIAVPSAVDLVLRGELGSPGIRLVRAMRELVATGAPEGSDSIELGHGIRVNKVLLALHRPGALLNPDVGFDEIQRQTESAGAGVLGQLRNLIHTGVAKFGTDRACFFEVFRLADALDLPECYEACSHAAGMRGADVTVQLLEAHDKIISERLATLYQAMLPHGKHITAGNLRPTSQAGAPADGLHDAELELLGAAPGSVWYAHRSVLAAVATYFKERSRQEPDSPWRLKLDCASDILSAILDFVYTGKASIPVARFRQIVVQADVWGLKEVSQACVQAVLGSEYLASMMLEEGHGHIKLPEAMVVAVAIGVPRAIKEGDVDAFILFASNPVIVCHLSVSVVSSDRRPQNSWPPPMTSTEALFGWQGYCRDVTRETYGVGSFKGVRSFTAGGFSTRYPLCVQLEQFIIHDRFLDMLQRPETMTFPLWSVVMIIESCFLRITYGHGRYQRASNWWEVVNPPLASWLLRWASSQQPETVLDCAAEICSAFHHVLRVRSLVRYTPDISGPAESNIGFGRANHKALWHSFWRGVFSRVLMDQKPNEAANHVQPGVAHSGVAAAAALVANMESHLQEGYRLNVSLASCKASKKLAADGGGAGAANGSTVASGACNMEPSLLKSVDEWTSAHEAYETAFAVVAARLLQLDTLPALHLSARGQATNSSACWLGRPWTDLGSSDLVRLISSEALPFDSADAQPLREILQRWLAAGTVPADERACELLLALSEAEQVLRYPLRTRNSRKRLQHMVSPAEVVQRVCVTVGVAWKDEGGGRVPSALTSALRDLAFNAMLRFRPQGRSLQLGMP